MGKRITQSILLVAILMTYSDVTCLPSFMFEEGSHVATTHVHHIAAPEQSRKFKREASSSLPSTLHFRFDLDNRPIRLRLKRAVRHGGGQLPVFILRHGAQTKRRMGDTEPSDFYHDLDHGAALMVTNNHDNPSSPFHLEGSLFIDGSEFSMAPSHKFGSGVNNIKNNKGNSSRSREGNMDAFDGFFNDEFSQDDGSNGVLHSFKRLNNHHLNYGQDWVDERDPFARIEARQREIERRLHRLGQGHGFDTSRRHKNSSSLTNGRARWKRQTDDVTETHFIEVSMIADFAVWNRFLEYADGDEDDAFKQLQQYYTLIAVMMDVRYQSVTRIDPRLIIRIHPISLVVTDVKDEAIWTEKNRVGRKFVNAISSLYTLRNWVRNQKGVPEADHTMLFTGYDIAGSGGRDTSTIGVAFIGTACTTNSVSLIEEYFTGTSGAVSAHELGHSLDAEHDGNYRQCSDYSANVMSTQAIFPTEQRSVSNPWLFSPCSVDAFGAFLETSKCTKNEPKSDEAKPLGRSFSADEQCRLANGPGSYFCRSVQTRRGFNTMCRQLYCYLPDQPGYCGSIIAGEFTTCGDKKWCSKAQCVPNENAPSVPDDCPQGDEPGDTCQGELDCDNPKVKDILCCQTCKYKSKYTTTPIPFDDNQLLMSFTSMTSLGTQTSTGSTLSTSGAAASTKGRTVAGESTLSSSSSSSISSTTESGEDSETTSSSSSSLSSVSSSTSRAASTTEGKISSSVSSLSSSPLSSSPLTTGAAISTDGQMVSEAVVSSLPPSSLPTTESIILTTMRKQTTRNEESSSTSLSSHSPDLNIVPTSTEATITKLTTSSPSSMKISSPPSNTNIPKVTAVHHTSRPFATTATPSPTATTTAAALITTTAGTIRMSMNTSTFPPPMSSPSSMGDDRNEAGEEGNDVTPNGMKTNSTLISSPSSSSSFWTSQPSSHPSSKPSSSSEIPDVKVTEEATTRISSSTPTALPTKLFSEPTSDPQQQISSRRPPPLSSSPPSSTTPTTTSTTTTTTTTATTTTATPILPPKPTPPPLVPCYSITCLCQRCFHCFYNVCYLFLPGGIYYKPDG